MPKLEIRVTPEGDVLVWWPRKKPKPPRPNTHELVKLARARRHSRAVDPQEQDR